MVRTQIVGRWEGQSPHPHPCALTVPGPPAQRPEDRGPGSSALPPMLAPSLPRQAWPRGRRSGGVHGPHTPASHQASEADPPGPLPGRGGPLSSVLTPSYKPRPPSGLALSGNLLAKHLAVNTEARVDGRSQTIKLPAPGSSVRLYCCPVGSPAKAVGAPSAGPGEGGGPHLSCPHSSACSPPGQPCGLVLRGVGVATPPFVGGSGIRW